MGYPDLWSALQSVVVAVLIGLLVGVQREVSLDENRPGVRDFVLIAATGGICGLLGLPWLTATALLAITVLLAAFHIHCAQRTGVTTEIAGVATFALGYLATAPSQTLSVSLAIALAIILTAFLEAKRSLNRFLRESVTEVEFNATLRFLAVIFLIYPVLPDGHFGPNGGFAPKATWMFVILVSSISYIGYFLEKYLGRKRGLSLTAFLGGVASTTAATASFARSSAGNPADVDAYAQAAVISNATQFPRLLALLLAINPGFAVAVLPALAAMTATGYGVAWLMRPKAQPESAGGRLKLGNPFALLPALKFGAIFAAVLFLSCAASAAFGESAVYWTGLLGGSIDVDAVVVTLSDLLAGSRTTLAVAFPGMLLALASNAVLKTGISLFTAPRRFTVRLAGGFGAMFVTGTAVWLFLG